MKIKIEKATKLYRPVGLKELELISNSNWKKFPPRLEWQPIFYPVLNEEYAAQIAREWNTKDSASGYCGVVTEFELLESHFSTFEVQNVGGIIHNELWVPAEELEEFNKNIVGTIRLTRVYLGSEYTPPDDDSLKSLLVKYKKDE